MKEHIREVSERIVAASKSGAPLEIRGGGTKRFLGNPSKGELLDVGRIRGIVDHDPSELTVAVHGGTRVAALEAALAESGQMLGFEPPAHDDESTIGGVIACGLSGPRRPALGACRDFMLGVTVIDGTGEILSFGGKVIKNVAGFDVTRLMAGSMGTLGVIVEAVFRVAAKPQCEATCVLELDQADAFFKANEFVGNGMPVTASCWHQGCLSLRLSGSEAGVERFVSKIGGQVVREVKSDSFWQSVRNQDHPFFAPGRSLWKIVTPPMSDSVPVEGDWLVEWHGALRWLSSDVPAAKVKEQAAAAGGAATLFRADPGSADDIRRFPELPGKLAELHKRLMDVFDPAGILNPGRMY